MGGEILATNLDRPERCRVFFYDDLGRFLGLVSILARVYWPGEKVVEEALASRPDLARYYEQVSFG
jgi:hypothetical protein